MEHYFPYSQREGFEESKEIDQLLAIQGSFQPYQDLEILKRLELLLITQNRQCRGSAHLRLSILALLFQLSSNQVSPLRNVCCDIGCQNIGAGAQTISCFHLWCLSLSKQLSTQCASAFEQFVQHIIHNCVKDLVAKHHICLLKCLLSQDAFYCNFVKNNGFYLIFGSLMKEMHSIQSRWNVKIEVMSIAQSNHNLPAERPTSETKKNWLSKEFLQRNLFKSSHSQLQGDKYQHNSVKEGDECQRFSAFEQANVMLEPIIFDSNTCASTTVIT